MKTFALKHLRHSPALLLADLVAALAALPFAQPAAVAGPIPDDCKTGGFAIGAQAWTFHRFTVFDAIKKAAEAGGKTIEFFPGQSLSEAQQDVKFNHRSPDGVIQQVKQELERHHIRPVNYGVVNVKTAEEWRQIFEFARKLNLYGITTESVDQLDVIEPLAREHDIRVGIHNHPRRANDPSYKVWDPNYVLSVVKDRDPRIGACADTGHWLRSGLDPLESLRLLRGRVASVHLKDLNEKGPEAHDVPYGTGVANIPALLNELQSQSFNGNISIEYEYNWLNSVPEVGQCIGFVRGYGSARQR